MLALLPEFVNMKFVLSVTNLEGTVVTNTETGVNRLGCGPGCP